MRENDETRKSRKRLGAFWGRVLCTVGIVLAIVGAFFVSIASEGIGATLGVAGYLLGARALGVTTIVLCVVAAFVGLFVGPYAMPGTYDELVNGIKEVIQDPLSEE
jgi:putative Mn2+ efflux pump MntP